MSYSDNSNSRNKMLQMITDVQERATIRNGVGERKTNGITYTDT
jgi:hypothetical protein